VSIVRSTIHAGEAILEATSSRSALGAAQADSVKADAMAITGSFMACLLKGCIVELNNIRITISRVGG